MSEESARFRDRARQCRALAEVARDSFSRKTLTEMADDLEAEAEKIEAAEAAGKLQMPPPTSRQ